MRRPPRGARVWPSGLRGVNCHARGGAVEGAGMARTPDAWLALPGEAEVRALMPPDMPYDFGFLPAMARLVMAHKQYAPLFGALFGQIMFVPGSLSRRERELIAAVTSAAQDCHYGTQSHAEFLRVEGGE